MDMLAPCGPPTRRRQSPDETVTIAPHAVVPGQRGARFLVGAAGCGHPRAVIPRADLRASVTPLEDHHTPHTTTSRSTRAWLLPGKPAVPEAGHQARPEIRCSRLHCSFTLSWAINLLLRSCVHPVAGDHVAPPILKNRCTGEFLTCKGASKSFLSLCVGYPTLFRNVSEQFRDSPVDVSLVTQTLS